METAVIVAAAGRGVRAGGKKQFYLLEGKPLLVHSLELFERCPEVDQVVLAVPEEDINKVAKEMLASLQVRKLKEVIAGGESRQETVYKALEKLGPAVELVLIHDGARPLVSEELLKRVIAVAGQKGAAVAGEPLVDTVKSVDQQEKILQTIPRKNLRRIQTPQGFHRHIIEEAYCLAKEQGWQGTDDASLVERAGYPVYVVAGEATNLKITTSADLKMAQALKGDSAMRVGLGLDIHPLVEGRSLILGGVNIPYHLGSLAHSDGDVLIHAIMDALLGAAGKTDIGTFFPDTEEEFKDISSMELLRRVHEMLQEEWKVRNLDSVLILERPRIASHVPRMKENIARVLDVKTDSVGIKATTAEGLGVLGSGEAVMAQVVANIYRR